MAASTSTPQPLTALPSPEQLKGQVFVILGGSAGMGKAVARSALARGADVVLVSRTESKLAAAKDELVSQGADEARISTAAVDGSDEEAMKTLFAGYEKGSIHHLVATAGASSGGGKFLDHSFEHVQAQLDAKVKVQWLAARYAAPVLAQGGSITFFTGGLSIRPGTGSSLLAMANASLEALTKALANELGPALRVNAVSPGLTRTQAFDGMPEAAREGMFAHVAASGLTGRAGDPLDMGEAALALAANGFITGAVLRVDGGHTVQ